MITIPELPGIENIDWFGATSNFLAQSVYWVGIILIASVLIAMLYFFYYYISFKYKVTIFPLYGSGKDGVFSFGKPKRNKVKWNKNKKAWIKMFPFFNKVEEEPFDDEYIYPGENIYAFELNGKLIPGRININKTEKEIRAEINPVPYYIRNWQSLQHKKNEVEFAQHDWWTDNKALVITLIICAINLALCLFTIWFTYKYAMGGREDIQTLAASIKNLGVAKGVVPG